MTSTDPKLPAGARPTRQRRAVAAVLKSFDDFRSARDIHDLLRRAGDNVGLSTVYRTLQALADKYKATTGQLSLAWLLKRSPVMLPIPGTSKVAHLEENVAAAAIQLSDEDERAITEARH